jgi:hypothetical protein
MTPKRPEDFDHFAHIESALDIMADMVVSDSRYTIERQEYLQVLASRFKREIREALVVDPSRDRRRRRALTRTSSTTTAPPLGGVLVMCLDLCTP